MLNDNLELERVKSLAITATMVPFYIMFPDYLWLKGSVTVAFLPLILEIEERNNA